MGCGDGIGRGEIRKVGGLGIGDEGIGNWGIGKEGIGDWELGLFFDNKPFELLPAGRQVLNFLNKAF